MGRALRLGGGPLPPLPCELRIQRSSPRGHVFLAIRHSWPNRVRAPHTVAAERAALRSAGFRPNRFGCAGLAQSRDRARTPARTAGRIARRATNWLHAGVAVPPGII